VTTPIHDLVIIGGGTAGLVAGIGAAAQGARTLLVERDRTGGDCLWTGCVPSKALISAAEAAHTARSSHHLGVSAEQVTVDFPAVMAHVQRAIATIEPHDSPDRLRREGVEVAHGRARFVADDAIEIDDRRVRFRRAMIATGATPLVPDLPGLAAATPLTSDTLWDLQELPERLVVLGAGPMGVELGQAFARLGSQVTIVELDERVLPGEERDASAVLTAALRADGVEVRTGTRAIEVVHDGGAHRLLVEPMGTCQRSDPDAPGTGFTARELVPFDRILVAVGRRPRTNDLGLEFVDVDLGIDGRIVVDDRMRTSNPRVYAGGDVTMQLPFTHVAAAHGAAVVQNAVFGLRARIDHERMPWTVFTSPEVARIGLTAAEAHARFGGRETVRTASHEDLDRAITAGATDGFARLIGDPKGRLVGATIVGPRAGETIGEVAAWMAGGAKLSAIARSATHVYPTWSEDVATASLEHLRDGLARIRPVTRLLLALRRLAR
jgi:pyruvate/2-oxoglutarate dehydrogenase complex dihydrolipoamide dehydrogenase (E3) component